MAIMALMTLKMIRAESLFRTLANYVMVMNTVFLPLCQRFFILKMTPGSNIVRRGIFRLDSV